MDARSCSAHADASSSRTAAFDPTLPPARIHIVGPNQALNQSLCFVLTAEVGAVCTCNPRLPAEVIDAPESDSVDIFLFDCLQCDREAIEKELAAQQTAADRKIHIVLFNIDEECHLSTMPGCQAIWGFFYRDDSKSIFIEGMQAIIGGRKWRPRSRPTASTRSRRLPGDSDREPLQALSPRESEIIQLVAVGMSNAEIAAELQISLHTVKTHIYNIYRKTGTPNRLQAALWVAARY